MKNLILVVLFSLFSLAAFSQSNIKVGVQGVYYEYFDGAFIGPSVGFEAPLLNRFSLQVNVAALRSNEVTGVDQNIVTRAIRFEPELRFYPRGDLKGFFIGPRLSYADMSSVIKTGGEKLSFPTWGGEEGVFGVGGVLGYQANFSDRFKISTTLGAELDMNAGEGGIGITSARVSVGYNF